MIFFPDAPELMFLYLHRQRLQEAEEQRLVRQAARDQNGLSRKAAIAIRNYWMRARHPALKRKRRAALQPEGSPSGIDAG